MVERVTLIAGFSALQRAENSSIKNEFSKLVVLMKFQCSSASRKFLNFLLFGIARNGVGVFQCSSASRKFLNPTTPAANARYLMFQCSSASRKFLNRDVGMGRGVADTGFSALQRAENSSIKAAPATPPQRRPFQCSSASRKFLNPDPRTCVHPYSRLRRSRFVVPEPSWCVAMTPVY